MKEIRTCYYSKNIDSIVPAPNALLHRLSEDQNGTLCGKDFGIWERWVIDGSQKISCPKCKRIESKTADPSTEEKEE